MKIVKILFVGLLLSSLFLTSCSKCDDEQPRARVVNNGTEKINVQIQTTDGNTVNINQIATGATSDWVNYAAGTVKFTISIGNTGDKVLEVKMENCWEYEITIDSENNVTSVPTDRNE